MKKISEQIVILSSIKWVRIELEEAIKKGESTTDIWNRLTTLYILLDTEMLIDSLWNEAGMRRAA